MGEEIVTEPGGVKAPGVRRGFVPPAGIPWTPEQREAITARNPGILVVAGAGAGKTAVLAGRVLGHVLDPESPLDIDQLLVVTFTESAAAEMRIRIARALEGALRAAEASQAVKASQAAETPGVTGAQTAARIREQLLLLDRASISTLHSFCLGLVRREFHRLGLDPSFRILSPHEAGLLEAEILEEVMETFYMEEATLPGLADPPFLAFVEAYGGGSAGDQALRKLILRIYHASRGVPWPADWLESFARAYGSGDARAYGPDDARTYGPGDAQDADGAQGAPDDVQARDRGPAALKDTPWFEPLLGAALAKLTRARRKLETALSLAMRPGGPGSHAGCLAGELDALAMVDGLVGAAGAGWDDLRAALLGWPFAGRLPSSRGGDPELRERARECRDKAKALYREAACIFSREAAGILAELSLLGPHVRMLVQTIRRFEAAFTEAKRKRAVLDFADLEHLALGLLLHPESRPGELRPSPLALELHSLYQEVLVDECQDLNGIQDAILQLLAGGSNGFDARGRGLTDGEASDPAGDPVSVPPSLFLVGDVKQCIYQFRLAEPRFFLQRAEAWAGEEETSAEEEGSTVDPVRGQHRGCNRRLGLRSNFRSTPAVLAAVNHLFRRIMVPGLSGMSYGAEDELISGLPPGPSAGVPAELHLLEKESGAGSGPGSGPGSGLGSGSEPESAPGDEAGNGDGDRGGSGDGDWDGDGRLSDPAGDPVTTAGTGAGPDPHSLDPAELSALEREALLVVRLIRELTGGRAGEVTTEDDPSRRLFRYGEITILMRAMANRANVFVEVLRKAGIPVHAELGTGYFSTPEVQVALAALQIVDNPRQDLPLAAVLRSPMVGLSSADLARIKLYNRGGDFYDALLAAAGAAGAAGTATAAGKGVPGSLGSRLAEFLHRLSGWRTAARRGPLAPLVWRIYQETGYLSYVGGMPRGAQRRANLLALHERARQFDGFSRRGLQRFLRFIEGLREAGEDLGTASEQGPQGDVVRIRSIHQSKGLEFPAVIVPGLGSPFNVMDEREMVPFHRKLGFGMPVVNLDLGIAYPSLAKRAVREAIRRDTLAEEMRILYVAMTRARERLLLVGSVRRLERAAAEWAGGRPEAPTSTVEGPTLEEGDLASARCFVDWLGPALADGTAPIQGGERQTPSHPWRVCFWTPDDLRKENFRVAKEPPSLPWDRIAHLQPLPSPPPDTGIRRLIEPRIAWSYHYLSLAGLPAKRSVTALAAGGGIGREFWDDTILEPVVPPESQPTPADGTANARAKGPFQTSAESLSPLARGTAFHLVLQHLDLRADLSTLGIARQVEEMLKRELLTPDQVLAADPEALACLFESPLGRRMVAARDTLRRELTFTLGVPASEIYPDLSPAAGMGERVVVQGVIDCLFEEGEAFVLIDYKLGSGVRSGTTAGEAKDSEGKVAHDVPDSYRRQLAIYRRAVESILRRPVAEAYFYFLAQGTAVRVEP